MKPGRQDPRGRGRGGGGRGGPDMKGGRKGVVVPHKHDGVFITKAKEDPLCTKNMVAGESVYGKKSVSVQVCAHCLALTYGTISCSFVCHIGNSSLFICVLDSRDLFHTISLSCNGFLSTEDKFILQV